MCIEYDKQDQQQNAAFIERKLTKNCKLTS
jgi:hypothetical protein